MAPTDYPSEKGRSARAKAEAGMHSLLLIITRRVHHNPTRASSILCEQIASNFNRCRSIMCPTAPAGTDIDHRGNVRSPSLLSFLLHHFFDVAQRIHVRSLINATRNYENELRFRG